MLCDRFKRLTILLALTMLVSLVSSEKSVLAQGPGGGGGGGGNGGAGGGGNGDEPLFGGIAIDASGILTARTTIDRNSLVDRQKWQAARVSLNQDVQKPSELRCVSLNRLEKEYQRLVTAGLPIPEEMNFLAGLTSISYVFFYPESGDIVIAGPAEGFFVNSGNFVVGLETGHSVLQLQDLVVALRAFGPDFPDTKVISCSIDPTLEGSKRLQQATTMVQQNVNKLTIPQIVQIFREALGYQEITIGGVSSQTNFARVMIEADYRMKLIGLGLENPMVPMTTYIQKATPAMVAQNTLVRWFFQPKYDCIRISPDDNAIQFVDGGVKLVAEDDVLNRDGTRQTKGRANKASQIYCESFTRVYDQLAETNPLWGELRNLMKMSMAAAYIQKYNLFEKAQWNMEFFGDENKFRTEIMNPPQYVAPVANAVMRNGLLMTPIAGGVAVQPRIALNSDRIIHDSEGNISNARQQQAQALNGLKDNQWWWD